MNVELLGFIAGIIICSAHIPQIYRSLKLKDTHAISLWLYVILGVAVSMWTVYGFFEDFVVFAMNATLLVFISTMIILKLKYGMGASKNNV